MTTKSIMTSGLFTLKPSDTVAHAMTLMHEHHVRNLPVVDEEGSFIGLFGLRRLSHLLLPKAALNLGKHSISSLHFLPDEVVQMGDRWHKIADQPVENFLEKQSKLLFCKPSAFRSYWHCSKKARIQACRLLSSRVRAKSWSGWYQPGMFSRGSSWGG